MKVVLINKFLYPKGGDAISTLTTGKLLTGKGHNVVFWGMDHPLNVEYPRKDSFVSRVDFNKPVSYLQRLKMSLKIFYSFEAKRKIKKLIELEKPDIIHLNNFAHQISPSILDVFKKYNIPVVMTMHDYKLVCPSYSMLSNGKPCERCKDSKYYWCFMRKCTKNSYIKSLVNTVEMYLHHNILHIYDLVDIFISPSMFLKDKLKDMGFKKEVVYLPNFLNTSEYEPLYKWNERNIVYFGRLSAEKGLNTLIKAMEGLDIGLKIIGDGPLKESLKLEVESRGLKNIHFLGYKSGEELKKEIKNSMAVVISSECYENNPRAVLEAFALGKPVIGAKIGGIPELVIDGKTGFTFEPGNSLDLREKILYVLNKEDYIEKMGKNARKFVEEKFTAEQHYDELIKIYKAAMIS